MSSIRVIILASRATIALICYNVFDMTDKKRTISNAALNRLRAAVLGANDGIVSTSSVVMGVAGATSETKAIITAGLAALVAGALSMAVGEYVSVSSQRDAEKVHHENDHRDDDHEYTSPTQAAAASLLAFTVGGLVPFVAVISAPSIIRIPVTVAAVVVALIVTGYTSASVGGASKWRASIRVVIGGLIAMAVTYFVGTVFGASFN
jgi:VIT1/CCC1 family predicted Fe2+/Mn2+ transporter